MKWYKSVEFWIGILITLAFFQLFYDTTFGFMWWADLTTVVIGMLLVLNSFKKLKI